MACGTHTHTRDEHTMLRGYSLFNFVRQSDSQPPPQSAFIISPQSFHPPLLLPILIHLFVTLSI